MTLYLITILEKRTYCGLNLVSHLHCKIPQILKWLNIKKTYFFRLTKGQKFAKPLSVEVAWEFSKLRWCKQ